jgi:hypothetical protein
VWGNKEVFNRAFHGKFTRLQVVKAVKAFMLQKRGKYDWFQISINIEDNGLGFKSCPSFGEDDEPNVLPQYDWEVCNGFTLYVSKLPENSTTRVPPNKTAGGRKKGRKMGDDETNDCLFNAIKKQLGGVYRLPRNYKTPQDLKRSLHIGLNDKIPMDRLPEIEKLLEININITGDHEYKSKNKQPVYTANLILKDEHITLAPCSKKLIRYIPKFTQEKLITYYITDNGVECYNGMNQYTIDFTVFQKLRCDVYNTEYCYRGVVKLDDLETEHNKIIYDTYILKQYSFGKHDLARSGYKNTKEALKTLHYSTLALRQPEPIIEEEEMPLHDAFCGGLMFSSECKLKNGRLIDINSFYLSVLSNEKFTFPLTCGDAVHYDTFPYAYYEYGLYHCIIYRSDDPMINRLFYFNKRNYYTHFCLTTAKELGLRIELIQDGEPNARLYKCRGQGKHYFGQMINELYDIKIRMKEDGVESKVANKILQCLFGTLGQKNKNYSKIGEQFDMSNPDIAEQTIRQLGKHHIVCYTEHGNFFKYDYARVCGFLTALCRRKLYETVKPYNQHIYRIFTDSILYDADAITIDVPINNKLGSWKVENEGGVVVKQHEKPKFSL